MMAVSAVACVVAPMNTDDDASDTLVWLEVNTQPGMTPTSLAPEQAAHIGVTFDRLVLWMVEDASCGR